MVLQDASSVAREGLPYWIFYLLLCLILLLFAFIFLRDKDLRLRLNEFLSGAKKRMKRTQMRIRLKRENKRKTDLLKELGGGPGWKSSPSPGPNPTSALLSNWTESARRNRPN